MIWVYKGIYNNYSIDFINKSIRTPFFEETTWKYSSIIFLFRDLDKMKARLKEIKVK